MPVGSRLGGPTPLLAMVLDAPVRLCVPDDLAAQVRHTLVDLPPSQGGHPRELVLEDLADGGVRLLDDGELILPRVDRELAVASLVWRLNAVAAGTTDHVVLHAGCVATPTGGVVLPGASGAGKSTLTAAAVTEGFGYLADEHAALSLRTGMLAPYPKPLDLGALGLVPASVLRPGSVGGSCAPLAALFPRYAAGSPTTVVALDAATTLLALCAQATNLPGVGAEGFAALAGLAEAVQAWQITYSVTADAVSLIGTAVGASPSARAVVPAPIARPVTPTTTTVILDDGSVVVLDALTWAVHRLNPAAGLIWLCAATTRDRNDLRELVQAEAPGGALDGAQVGSTIDHLAAIGLLHPAPIPAGRRHG